MDPGFRFLGLDPGFRFLGVDSKICILGFGFLDSDLCVWIHGFRFLVLTSWIRVHVFRLLAQESDGEKPYPQIHLDFGTAFCAWMWVRVFEFLWLGSWVPGLGFRLMDSGVWIRGIEAVLSDSSRETKTPGPPEGRHLSSSIYIYI